MALSDFLGFKKKPAPVRGPGGKFVSTKPKTETPAPSPTPTSNASPLPLVKFFGQPIRRYLVDKNIYFVISDIFKTAIPQNPPHLQKKPEFETVRLQVTRKIETEDCADTKGILELIKEIQDPFPGPLPEWIRNSSI